MKTQRGSFILKSTNRKHVLIFPVTCSLLQSEGPEFFLTSPPKLFLPSPKVMTSLSVTGRREARR